MAAQDVQVELVASALWPQGDVRDPLGVWGGREILTATVGGGELKVRFAAAAAIAGAYVYTCYSANISGLSADESAIGQCRLLTNWPDIDTPEAGVQGYGSNQTVSVDGGGGFTGPFTGQFDYSFIQPNDRFLLLFDPRPVAGAFDVVSLALDRTVDTRLYTFEAYGYYWDRSVLNAPGGPRHPGSS